MEKAKQRLAKKRVPWKASMLVALENALQKLRKYYTQTIATHGDLYGLAILLHPVQKRQFWRSGDDWDISHEEEYWRKFETLFSNKYRCTRDVRNQS